MQDDNDDEMIELGLSLRLQTSSSDRQIRQEDRKGESQETPHVASMQNKLHQSHLSAIPSHVVSPPNKKARVSVRARCQTATVSLIYA